MKRHAIATQGLLKGQRAGIKLLLLLMVLGLLIAGCQRQQTWQEFIPEDKSFAILMPGIPKADAQTRDGVTGMIYVSEDRDTGIMYMVGHFDYPQGIPDNLLERTASGHEVGPFDKLEINEIELSGHHGQEIIYKAFGAPMILTRLYQVRNRVYTISVIVPADELRPEQVDQFFGSLRLDAK